MSEPLQHSPGPWKATGNGVHVGIDCIAITHADTKEQRIIDARLIAAAPDMLRLLRVLSEKSESGADTKDEWYVWRDAMQDAKALITRLDGGE